MLVDVVSFNVAQNRIKAFDVYLELRADGSAQATSIEKMVTSAIKQRFSALLEAYKTVSGELDIYKEVPASITPSAYRLVQTKYLQKKYIFYLKVYIFMKKSTNISNF